MPHVEPSAIVDPRAELADDVRVGPFCVIGPQARIGAGTTLGNNVTIMGRVEIGEGNQIFPNAVIGGDPQDISYRGSDTRVEIGDHNVIREGVTINRGSEKEAGLTSLGSGCFIMGGCHIAHDCRVGNRVIMANATLLGGHVHVHDDATVSGGVAVHHFTTLGSFSFTGGLSRVLHDVPPYMLAEGNPSKPRCINIVALKRNSFSAEAIRALAEAHRLLYRSKVGLDHARELLRAGDMLLPAVNHLLSFLQNQHEGRNGRGRDRRRAA
ncbi:MAG: acyl-ACP--UDP-N-acetylglucosamine O-acyltransferase [Pirellulaceae bacterium]|nr:acyl-ACP--UDP-N-acetylglucosamine O-acyltransferase [Pirellulaceae bacterium]